MNAGRTAHFRRHTRLKHTDNTLITLKFMDSNTAQVTSDGWFLASGGCLIAYFEVNSHSHSMSLTGKYKKYLVIILNQSDKGISKLKDSVSEAIV